jgi:hypothetical protein
MFTKYQHLERFGTDEVVGIDCGECFIFPKLDGANASIWYENGEIKAGSRNRQLTLEKDNAGFYQYVLDNKEKYERFFKVYPNLILYGEWLVPHTIKTYRDTAWRNFYVFDVYDKEYEKYTHFNHYIELLNDFDILAIYPIVKINNPTYDLLLSQLEKNTYLIDDGKGYGEGIVIKNYFYTNKYGSQIWAKIVRGEFKEQHAKTMGVNILNGEKVIEQIIAEKYITLELCEKELAKIINENNGWQSKHIPQLLNTIYHCLIVEEMWNILKDHKNPLIHFGILKNQVTIQIKKHLSRLF